jgi:hypothetical protein
MQDLYPECPWALRYCAAMTWKSLLAYCLAKPGGWQDEPVFY